MSETTALTVPAAGWYPDRNEANTVRWWDGQQWTDQTQTTAPAAVAFEQPVSMAAFAASATPQATATPDTATPDAWVAPAAAAAPGASAPAAAVAIPPGWYPDNYDASLQRWWDGTQWTPHTSAATSVPYGAETRPVSSGSNVLATLAMVLSIGSFGGLIFAPLLLLALIGVVLGIVALVRARRYAPGTRRRGQAIAAIIVGAASLILTVLLAVVAVFVYQQVHPTVGSQASGQQSNPQTGSGTGADGDAGISSPSTLSQLKQTIAGWVEQQNSVTVTSVTCDAAASMAAGSTFDCGVGVTDGRWSPIRVYILAPTESGMSYSLQSGPLLAHDAVATSPTYTLDQLESELSGNLATAWSDPISDLRCDSTASMTEGSSFDCSITLVNGNTGVVLINMVAPDGYDLTVLQSPLGAGGAGGSGGSDATDPDLSNS